MSAFWAAGDGPTDSVTRNAIEMAGLEYIGNNKQDRVRNALYEADDSSASEAIEELLYLLQRSNAFTRARRGGPHDEAVTANVDRLRQMLAKHGWVLTSSGDLEVDQSTEDDAADSAPTALSADISDTDLEPKATTTLHREAYPTMTPSPSVSSDPRRVFLVHGRDHRIKDSMVELIEAFDLKVFEWEEAVKLTCKPSPTTMEVVSAGMEAAAAIVVLFTPDDEGRCRPQFMSEHDGQHELEFTPQARMNVIFEAGMAMYKDSQKTVLVRFGSVREMSDISGVNYVRIRDTVEARRAVGSRLTSAGAEVDMARDKWRDAGDFSLPAATETNSTPSPDDPNAQPEPPPDDLAARVINYATASGSDKQFKLLVKQTTRTLRQEISNLPLAATNDEELDSLEVRYRTLFELSEPLLGVLKTSIDYGIHDVKDSPWIDAFQQLVDIRSKVRPPTGQAVWRAPDPRHEKARHFPALLAFRVAGLTALCGNDAAATLWIALGEDVKWRSPDLNGTRIPKTAALRILDEYEVLDERAVMTFDELQLDSTRKCALSRYLRKVLRPLFVDICPDDNEWDRVNDQFEYRRAMLYVKSNIEPGPVLASNGDGRWTSAGWGPEADFRNGAEDAKADWPWWPIIGDQAQLEFMIQQVRSRLGQRFMS